MASLTITVGPISSSIQVPDERAQEILIGYANEYKLPQVGNAQARLDELTRHLAKHVVEAANAYDVRAGAEAERERLRSLLQDRRWE